MSNATTYLHFAKHPVHIPNAAPNTGNAEADKLQSFIDQYEEQYLRYIMGYELSELYIQGEGDSGIYDKIRNGDTFTDQLGLLQKWEGFATAGKNPIACYIYWFWQNSNASNTYGIGEATANVENATRTSPAPKARIAWNKMVELNKKLHGYLFANRNLYPSYIGLTYLPTGQLFKGLNVEELNNYQNLFAKQTWL